MYGGRLSDFFLNPCNPSSHTAYIMLCNILALLCMKMRNRRTICSKRRSSISIITLLFNWGLVLFQIVKMAAPLVWARQL